MQAAPEPLLGTPLSTEQAMRLALQWAEQAIGLSDPNPRVGCVLLNAQGGFMAAGHTQAAGQAHAEVMALRSAQQRGLDVRGATAVVTLEPCSHTGRTAPCTEALVAAGLARLIAAVEDPNPEVCGRGFARLRAAGMRVEVGLLSLEAEALNAGFFKRMRSGRPFVRMKLASSLDGFSAHPDGHSRWITGPAARLDGQRWRRRAGAVLTGIGTALADNPRLDVRDIPTRTQPLRVVLDTHAHLPPGAKLLAAPGEALVIHGPDASTTLPSWMAPVTRKGRINLHAVLGHLGGLGVNELHIEAGATLSGAWLAEGLVDELLMYIAPRLLGQGRPLAPLPKPTPLDDVHRWRWLECTPLEGDLRLRLAKPG